ncbi:MAG: sensor histidine kinase [Firmicutes bacterium]|nr:sensor histidine kinase [Bacillota bacterium]
MNGSGNKRAKRVSTGSIAFRIALGSAFRLLLVFVVIDVIVVGILAAPQMDFRGDPAFWDALRQGGEAVGDIFRDRRMDLLLQAEGLIIILRLIFDTIRIRRQLRPIDEMAAAAERLSNMDVNFDERFRVLENAIDGVNPNAEDAALATGDAELAGLESAVNKLMERMREANRQQARFVSDASHELRTPIAVIRGYADMLDRWGTEDEKVLRESIDAIKGESENMQHLVEQLLFLARGDSGRTPLNIADISLTDMMREVYEESSMIDPAHNYSFDGGGGVTARGDASLLKQTARILCENAKKYTPEGGDIALRAFVKDGRPGFSVQDSGIGIASEDLPHVFERFYRADDSRARQTGGTGLGLAIAKWIVDRHGAHFDVVSRKDVGTRISVIM